MIREATRADVPALAAMGARFVTETEYARHLALNPVAITQVLEHLIASPTGTVLVAERDGALIAMLGLAHYPHPMSGEPVASELFWWCNPDARGGGAAIRLLKHGEAWARTAGARRLLFVAPNAAVGALYARLGYEAIEVTYQRSLDS